MAELATSVWLEQEGAPVCFAAGSTPPAWAAALITNPGAWAAEADIPVDAEPGESLATDEVAGDESEVVDSAEGNDSGEVSIPPKAGPGSSASAWAAYALSQGFAVEEDAKASEIREALAEADIPVE